MTHFEKMRPVNHGYRRGIAALLQSYADKPGEETKRQLARFLPPKVLRTLTTERARELAEKTREKEKRLNTDFVCELVAKVRAVVREARQRGMSALILVEPIDSDSLKGTELQGTLLRGRRRLMNLAVYEGARWGRLALAARSARAAALKASRSRTLSVLGSTSARSATYTGIGTRECTTTWFTATSRGW
jgi:hypothetical protein